MMLCIPYIIGETMYAASVVEGHVKYSMGYNSYIEALEQWEKLGQKYEMLQGVYGLSGQWNDGNIDLYINEEYVPWATLRRDGTLIRWHGVLIADNDDGYVTEWIPMTNFEDTNDLFAKEWNNVLACSN